MKQAMFERDLLYPTAKQDEPGSVHITVFQPEKSGGLPILVEAKTEHNPLDYIPVIVNHIQSDIFDRICIDIRKSGILYFKADQNRYCRIRFQGQDQYSTEFIDSF